MLIRHTPKGLLEINNYINGFYSWIKYLMFPSDLFSVCVKQ